MSAARAVIYTRISHDPSGQALGVGRQEDDCRELAGRRGWDITHVLVDNDYSAYSRRARPGYQRLLELIEADAADLVVAWHPDRLHRSPLELEAFIELIERHHVQVETVQAGPWDLATPAGRMLARQLGVVARYESEHRSARIRRALEQKAERGLPHGRVPYGYQRLYDPETGIAREVLDPVQAAVIRRMADAVAAGGSIHGIARDLDAEGVPAPEGGRWVPSKVNALLKRARNAGLRVHHAEVVGEGAWEPILEVEQWQKLMAILEDPSRAQNGGGVSGPKSTTLLSGIMRCGVCDKPVVRAANRGLLSYRCPSGHLYRSLVKADEYVSEVVLRLVVSSELAELVLSPGQRDEMASARAEAQGLRALMDQAADQYADEVIDAVQLQRINRRLRPRLEDALARAARSDPREVFAGLMGHTLETAREKWAALPLERQRAVVRRLYRIRLKPTQRGERALGVQGIAMERADQ